MMELILGWPNPGCLEGPLRFPSCSRFSLLSTIRFLKERSLNLKRFFSICIFLPILLITVLVASNAALADSYNYVNNGNFSSYTTGTAPIANPAAASASWDSPAYFNDFYDVTNSTGWTFSTGSGILLVPGYASTAYWPAPPADSSSQFAFLQSYPGWTDSTLEQSVSGLTVGDNYALTFSLSAPLGSTPVNVYLGGTLLDTLYPGSAWASDVESFTATSAVETLEFETADGGVTGLTDVSIATPEPSSLLLMGSGLFGLAGVALYKSKHTGISINH